MASRPDVVVVGGGVIGVCSAYYLAERGLAVTLVDKGDICAGSSYGNAGLIVPSHSMPLAAPGVLAHALKWMLDPESPFYIKVRPDPDLLRWLWKFRGACTATHVRRAMPVIRDLSHASLALYRQLAALPGFDFAFEEKGVLAVYNTVEGFAAGQAEARLLESAGLTARGLDATQARQLEPSLLPSVVGGVHFPGDAHLVPDAFVRGLARLAEKAGARLLIATEVLGFCTRGRRIEAVETTRGDLEAGEVVLAAGSWSSGLARRLDLRVPIQPAKGYSVSYRRPPDGPRAPLLLGEAKVGVTPMGNMLRLAGTLELAGLDLSINRRRVEAVKRSASRYLTGIDNLPLLEIWRGLRPCTPDGLPVIGRPRAFDNLVLASGHAMIGMSLGPVTGKLITELVMHEPPSLDLAPLRPDRF